MTGDGVNDILAMKEADCSVTVATGSDATKNIAHIVLMDNNFNSMPQVVAEGRRVINNIEKSSSLFLMKTLFTMVYAFITILRNELFPFDTQMMMLLELAVIGLGSFALSMQPNDKKVEGRFIGYLVSHSIPAAMILIFNVSVIELLARYCYVAPNILPHNVKDTLNMAALTFGGIAYLHIICKPYDVYRFTLVSFITLVSTLFLCTPQLMAFLDKPALFYEFGKYWGNIALLVAMISIDVYIGAGFTALINFIGKMIKKRK